MGSPPPTGLPVSPWVLVDDTTLKQTASLLEALTSWLLDGEPAHTADLAKRISDGDTDAAGVAHWVDALAGRLRRCAEATEL